MANGREHVLGGAEQIAELRQRERVERLPPLWPASHQAAVAQAAQMCRDGRLGHPQLGDEVDHAPRAALKGEKDPESGRVGEAAEQRRRDGGAGLIRMNNRHLTMITLMGDRSGNRNGGGPIHESPASVSARTVETRATPLDEVPRHAAAYGSNHGSDLLQQKETM